MNQSKVISIGSYSFDYKIGYESEKNIYKPPLTEDSKIKSTCCQLSNKGRIINIIFDKLSHINSDDSPTVKCFSGNDVLPRPSVERMISND